MTKNRHAHSTHKSLSAAGQADLLSKLIRLSESILTDWGNTLRVLAIIAVVITGLWLLRADIDLGPLQLHADSSH